MSDASPRILVTAFAPFPAPTGAATRLAQRVTAFAEAGYMLDVLTPKTPELPHVSKLLGARILRVPMPTGRDLRAAAGERVKTMPGDVEPAPLALRYAAFERAVRRQLQGNDYDVVHTFDPWSGEALDEIKGSARIVFEAGGRTPPGDGDAALSNELRRREREVFRSAQLLIVPTEEVALRARGLGAPKGQIQVVRPSADLELFAPPPDRRRRVSSPVKLVLPAGSLGARELRLVAEAMRLVPDMLEVQLSISAPVPPAERRRLAFDEELEDRLRFVDPVLYEDLGPLYQAADIGLVVADGPVRGELAAPRLQAVAEMMASGLALVLPDVAAVREIASDGRHAMLVPPGDAEALSSAIRTLVTQPARRRLLGQAARARAAEALDERRATAKLLGLYASMLSPSISIAATAYLDSGTSNPSQKTASSPAPTPSGLDSAGTRPTASANVADIAGAHLSAPRRPRPPLRQAAEPDAPTLPDASIHQRVTLAELASAAQTDPEGLPPRR